jgi:hypothetical protein
VKQSDKTGERCREREREREREIDRTLTGVEREIRNTFDPTIKNTPRLIKFSFENKIYNYFIFKGLLYSLVDENERNNLSLNSVEWEGNNILHLTFIL